MNGGELTLFMAMGAGVLSFLSPCVAPLVPGYLALISGATGIGPSQQRAQTERAVLASTLFVVGFSAVFVALGAMAAVFGALLDAHRPTLLRVSGVLMVVMGLLILGLIRWSTLWREWRLHPLDRPAGLLGALAIGGMFGLGWTPCIGPVLASILVYTGSAETIERGALLLLAYSLGLGIPFILAAMLIGQLVPLLRALRPWAPIANWLSGLSLIGLGALFLTNQSFYLSVAAQRLYYSLGR